MASTVSVVVCGGINVDRTFMVDRLPVKGETVMGKSSFCGVGGKAANTAVACSKSGASTSFLGAFGDDSYTEMLENEMKKQNVGTSICYRLKNSKIACGQAYIFLLPDGDNSIIVAPAANKCWPNKFEKEQIEAIKKCDCILLQREVPEEYNIRIAKLAKENNIMVVLDVGGEDSKISEELLSMIDILSPNETELSRLITYYDPRKAKRFQNISTSKYSQKNKIKGAAAILRAKNKNMSVLVKRGGKGSMFIDKNGNVIEIKAINLKPNQIADTTGAGDCFTGSFAVELIRQQKLMGLWKNNKNDDKEKERECIANAMKFGNAAAGISVQKKGTIASIPDLRDVVRCVLSEF